MKALAEKRSLSDLKYDKTKIALLTDFLEDPTAEHPTIKRELLPEDIVFKIIVVDKLPDVRTASPTAIYLLPKDKPEINNSYWEYIKTEPQKGHFAWERVGDTDVDLSDYAKKSDVVLTKDGYWCILGPADGPNADKPLVSAKALEKISNPSVGTVASVLGWIDNNQEGG